MFLKNIRSVCEVEFTVYSPQTAPASYAAESTRSCGAQLQPTLLLSAQLMGFA